MNASGDRRNDGEKPVPEAEWAWVREVYSEIPAPSTGAVDRVAIATAAAVAGRSRTGAAQILPWAMGAAAVLAIAIAGWRLVAPRPTAPLADVGPRPGVRTAAPISAAPRAPEPAPAVVDGAVAQPSAIDTSTHAPIAPVPAPPADRSQVAQTVPVAPAAPPDLAIHPPPAIDRPAEPPRPPADPAPVTREVVRLPGVSDDELARLRTALGNEGLDTLAQLIHGASGDGLPTAPLLDRALAGLARGASSRAIVDAVGRRAAALQQARGVLGAMATAGEMTAGADALESGAGVAQLAEIRRRFPRGRAAAGLVALAGLVADGVPAPAAADALARGVDAGASDATLLGWRAGVMSDVARGVTPLAALQAQVESLGDARVEDHNPAPPNRNPTPVPAPPPP